MLCVLMGPSGAGKSTLMQNLRIWDSKAELLESTTTRTAKPGDLKSTSGIYNEYQYVTDTQFDKLEQEGKFAWPVAPHGNRYGTLRSVLDQALESKKLFLAALRLEAVAVLKEYAAKHHPKARIKYIYLHISDLGALEGRLIKRGDSEEDRKKRLDDNVEWEEGVKALGIPHLKLDALRPIEQVFSEATKYLTG